MPRDAVVGSRRERRHHPCTSSYSDQDWEFIETDNDYYQIRNRKTGYCLEGNNAPAQEVCLDDREIQQWSLRKRG
jgi:Ricin-type beta-trefoil lectin domain-like